MNKQFKILYYSSGLSNIADGMNISLIPLLAVSLTRSPQEISILAMTRTIPWFLLSLHSGHIIDRHSKKSLLLISGLIRSASFLMLLTLIATNSVGLTSLAILNFIIGSCEVFVDNTTSCLIPKIVTKDQLHDANGKIVSLEILTNKFIGVSVGAIIFSRFGPTKTSITIFILYSLATIAFNLLSVKEDTLYQRKTSNLLKDTFGGIRVIRENSNLKIFMTCSAIGNAVYAAFEGILVLYVISILKLPKDFYGIAISALGIGSFLGGRAAKLLLKSLTPKQVYIISTASFPLFFVLIPLFANTITLVLSLFSLGFFFTTTIVITRSFRQKVAEKNLGKVNGVYRLVSWGIQPVAALAGGLLASKYGVIDTYYLLAFLSAFGFFVSLKLKSKTLNRHQELNFSRSLP